MTFYGNEPVRFDSGVSMVTATLGPNDPEVGARTVEGDEEYIFVYNTGGSTINVGNGAVLSAVTGYSVTVSSVTSVDFLVGVCKHSAIATTEYGWLVTKGFTSVEMGGTSGTVAAGGLIELGDDGEFYPVSNTTGNGPVVGKAMAAIVSAASGDAFISVN
jgi:hypothetical protein